MVKNTPKQHLKQINTESTASDQKLLYCKAHAVSLHWNSTEKERSLRRHGEKQTGLLLMPQKSPSHSCLTEEKKDNPRKKKTSQRGLCLHNTGVPDIATLKNETHKDIWCYSLCSLCWFSRGDTWGPFTRLYLSLLVIPPAPISFNTIVTHHLMDYPKAYWNKKGCASLNPIQQSVKKKKKLKTPKVRKITPHK